MILGDLSSVFEGDNQIYEAINNNVVTSVINKAQKPGKISKILQRLSNYGMTYSDKLYSNMRAVPADKNLQNKDDMLIHQTMYASMMNNWKVKAEEDKDFHEKEVEKKREMLRKMAMQPELEDILDIMANESIVYDDDEAYVCKPFIDTALVQDLNEKSADEIRTCVDTAFFKIYSILRWKTLCWDQYKRYLIDGTLAFHILYDDIAHPKSIIDVVEIDPATLTKSVEDSVVYWIQYKGVIGREHKLLDAEIIYIKYEDSGVTARTSYLERLIRPFNLYRIVEQAQVIWTVTQSSFKTMFTIPVGDTSRAKGYQTLSQTMNRYKEDISFNVETGELMVNGKVNMPFNKEYWLPENSNGKPEIETLVDNGPQLNDSDQIKYFEQKLYKMSRIPQSRFDKDAQATWFGADPTSTLRDEIMYSRFVTRMRNNFAQILLKPLKIQLSLSIPDIKNDKRVLDAVSLKFNSYNEFEEMANIEVMTKRVEFIGTMKDSLVIQDGEDEVPYFDPKFLIIKYLKMSDADLEMNEKFKWEAKHGKKKKDDEESEDEDNGDDGGFGGESDESGDIDSEMLGDVEPESSETTQA